MSDIDNERIRSEAAEAVGSRPPEASQQRVEAAMRRYLGTSMFEMLKGSTSEANSADEDHTVTSSEGHR